MTDLTAAARRGAAAPAGVTVAAWDLRVLRAVPFALVCTLIAAVGHALVGGGEVAPRALVTGFLAVGVLAALLGGRERGLPVIAAALGLGQLGLHCLFHGLSGGMTSGAAMTGMHHPDALTQAAGRLLCDDRVGNGPTPVPPGTTAEQVVSAAGLDPQAFTATAAGTHASGLLGMTPGMLLGHLAAALVAGWWLRRGEAALWRLVRLTAHTARQVAGPLRTVLALAAALLLGPLAEGRTPARRRTRAEDWRLPAAAALLCSPVRRGPPAAFAR
ncbi:hypothetical protein ACGFX4_08555 [Kitasatospora sp. NPDC048365]|uniref:hypothetical protein n=1 Tax=Kitasatospora sp. NPDC048365 TaxID=3364050 RepID=UPI00371E1AA6